MGKPPASPWPPRNFRKKLFNFHFFEKGMVKKWQPPSLHVPYETKPKEIVISYEVKLDTTHKNVWQNEAVYDTKRLTLWQSDGNPKQERLLTCNWKIWSQTSPHTQDWMAPLGGTSPLICESMEALRKKQQLAKPMPQTNSWYGSISMLNTVRCKASGVCLWGGKLGWVLLTKAGHRLWMAKLSMAGS